MKFIKLFAIGVACLIIWYSCVSHDLNDNGSPGENEINIRWVKAYPTETQHDILTGLAWSMSFLGASLPKGSLTTAIDWKDERTLTLNISKLGFAEESEQAFRNFFHVLKNSEEYRLLEGIDIGRFIMLTLNSTNHYYAITGAKKTYFQFRSQYIFDNKKAAVILSTVAFGNRIIEISNARSATQIAFIAMEGNGRVVNNSFIVEEYECIDVMANGQLRFALYDINGNLKTSSSPDLTKAGKPAKCLWCHEIHLIAPFNDNHKLPTYFSTTEFKEKIQERVDLMQAHREQLNSEIDFTKLQDHTKSELLYLSFMESSAERLSEEWGLSIAQVKDKLRGLQPHPHQEFSFLGNALYHRKDVAEFSPFFSIPTPDEPREFSPYEPDFIH